MRGLQLRRRQFALPKSPRSYLCRLRAWLTGLSPSLLRRRRFGFDRRGYPEHFNGLGGGLAGRAVGILFSRALPVGSSGIIVAVEVRDVASLEQDRRVGRGERQRLCDRRCRCTVIAFADREGRGEVPIERIAGDGRRGLVGPRSGGLEVALRFRRAGSVEQGLAALPGLEAGKSKRPIEIERGLAGLVRSDPQIAGRGVHAGGLRILVARGFGGFLEA